MNMPFVLGFAVHAKCRAEFTAALAEEMEKLRKEMESKLSKEVQRQTEEKRRLSEEVGQVRERMAALEKAARGWRRRGNDSASIAIPRDGACAYARPCIQHHTHPHTLSSTGKR